MKPIVLTLLLLCLFCISRGQNKAIPTGVKSYIDTAAEVQSDGSLIIRYPNGVLIKVKPSGERVLLKE